MIIADNILVGFVVGASCALVGKVLYQYYKSNREVKQNDD